MAMSLCRFANSNDGSCVVTFHEEENVLQFSIYSKSLNFLNDKHKGDIVGVAREVLNRGFKYFIKIDELQKTYNQAKRTGQYDLKDVFHLLELIHYGENLAKGQFNLQRFGDTLERIVQRRQLQKLISSVENLQYEGVLKGFYYSLDEVRQ